MEYDWDEKPELNITPMVDIMLVLLAILMVIAPNVVFEETIMLPQGVASKQVEKIPPVHITITKDKIIKVNKNIFQIEGFADNFYLFSKKLNTKSTVLISADKRLDYGLVMDVLQAVKQAGFVEVSLATNG
ncbi:MAG: biopolymer transporter ExbD [Epsilonproteobacteria bacterium]|nr:biopolymer transporter ExbD [Campylobacterota bacterium]